MMRMINHLPLMLLLLALASVARADNAVVMTQSALTSGGGTMTADGYTITSSIGQPFAGIRSAGEYTLSSGMPISMSAGQRTIYLPHIRR